MQVQIFVLYFKYSNATQLNSVIDIQLFVWALRPGSATCIGPIFLMSNVIVVYNKSPLC